MLKLWLLKRIGFRHCSNDCMNPFTAILSPGVARGLTSGPQWCRMLKKFRACKNKEVELLS